MTKKNTFSKQQELFSKKEKEIIVREDAPEGLRGFIKMAHYDLRKKLVSNSSSSINVF
jgi:hypothetical protein